MLDLSWAFCLHFSDLSLFIFQTLLSFLVHIFSTAFNSNLSRKNCTNFYAVSCFFLRIYFTCWLFPAQSFINAFRCPPSVNHNRGNNSGSVLVMLSLKVKSYSAIYAPNLPFLAVPAENKRIRELRYRTVNLWKLQQKWSTSHSFTNFYRTCLWFRQLPEYIFFVILSKIIHAVFLYTNVSSFDFKFWKIIRIEVSYHYEILHFFDVNWELHLKHFFISKHQVLYNWCEGREKNY